MIKRALMAVATSLVMLSTACTIDPSFEDGDLVGLDGNLTYNDTFDSLSEDENDSILFSESAYSTDPFLETTTPQFSRTIYIDAVDGDDTNDGLSEAGAIKSLAKLEDLTIAGGDKILLKGYRKYHYYGSIRLEKIAATAANPIYIGSYGECKARIDAQGEFAAIFIHTTSNVIISDLKITADGYPTGVYSTAEGVDKFPSEDCPTDCTKDITSRYGLMIYSEKGNTIENHLVYNVDFHDIFYFNKGDYEEYGYSAMSNRPCREWSTSYETEYGWGIRIYAAQSSAKIYNVNIDNCNIRNVSHTGIKSNNNGKVYDLNITNTNIHHCGGPGAQFNNVNNGVMDYCKTTYPGSSTTDGAIDNRKWGRGSGMWCHSCDGFLFDHNYYYRSEGIADCCGAHIDMKNKNILIQYCLSVNNCGGFIEVLGYNSNCCYRYNISIDDGWRNIGKDDIQDAYWGETVGGEGCLMTVNGHTGGSSYEGPYNTYIYNNTIICSDMRYDGYTNPFVFEAATSNRGLLVANNILWINKQAIHTYCTHSVTDNGDDTYTFNEKATDYKYGDLPFTSSSNKYNTKYFMTNDMVDVMATKFTNNLYRLYDPTDSTYPCAENALPDNQNPWSPCYTGSAVDLNSDEYKDRESGRYKDLEPYGGNPGFAFVSGLNPTQYEAKDAIPTNASVINNGVEITLLPTDTTPYGVSYRSTSESVHVGLAVDKDFFGNTITTPIIGACMVQ